MHSDLFPRLVSYNRFAELQQHAFVVFALFLKTKMGRCTGISFIDSTTLKVCRNQRIHSHKVFRGLAERGKSSMGWFYGFKLHLVCNERGELLSFYLPRGNVDDRNPKHIKVLCENLFGKTFGDKGYISQMLFADTRLFLPSGSTALTGLFATYAYVLMSYHPLRADHGPSISGV